MTQPQLQWLEPGDEFPAVSEAWGPLSPAPGLMAAGGQLDTATLVSAYARGIFPWFSGNQPILWWSPDPRMVLHTAEFRVHRSLRQSIARFRASANCDIRIDACFQRVIEACSQTPRAGQDGTWIVPDMVDAYSALHQAGHAHSVETWVDGALVGGLYCVNLGGAVFGESMFSHATGASKLALAALVALCRAHHIALIDCQQNTRHLASLGAREIGRADFVAHLTSSTGLPPPLWQFKPIYWNHIIPAPA